jgi:endonuclease-3 related protein
MAASRGLLPSVDSKTSGDTASAPSGVSTFASNPILPISTTELQSDPYPRLPGVALPKYFETLFAAHGPQHWWPARTRFEMIVGAILTQNTSWTNVERAIRNLRAANLLSPKGMRAIRASRLASLLRPSGYFRQKTKTIKCFVQFLYKTHRGSLSRMFGTPTELLREQILAVHGIGPETADSILLYAGKQPVFVVDAYTRRILERHSLSHYRAGYEEIRAMLQTSLPRDQQLFNEFHALIVHVGKNFCRPNHPRCSECSLSRFLPQSMQPLS